jgi:hypothetical protein
LIVVMLLLSNNRSDGFDGVLVNFAHSGDLVPQVPQYGSLNSDSCGGESSAWAKKRERGP